MKFKAMLLSATACAAISGLVSCGAKQAETIASPEALPVEYVINDAENIIGDTVEIEGRVSHLCAHGGRKAFLAGSVDTAAILRCEATVGMGGAFAPDSKGKTIIVKGIVRENRIDAEAIANMEARHAAADSAANAHGNCDTEKKALGQQNIDSFEARMADFRAKIAARDSLEGKPYLSNYFIETLSYTVDTPETEAE